MALPESLAFGLLDTSARMSDPVLTAKLRSFTVSWMRYDHHGPIFEGRTLDEIVSRTFDEGYDFCLVQAYGHVIVEPWTPPNRNSAGFYQTVLQLMTIGDFLVVTSGDSDGHSCGDPACQLVNVRRWDNLGRPSLPDGAAGEIDGASTSRFPSDVAERIYSLASGNPEQMRQLAGFLDAGIDQFDPQAIHQRLANDQQRFLRIVHAHAHGAQRGVFLWNVESYGDLGASDEFGFTGPVDTLACVAAGFKPNMILQTHGYDQNTRVIFFDYSTQALAFRRLLLEEWDGEDYPRFLEYALRRLPAPETFYHLWNDARPDQVSARDSQEAWNSELERCGGARTFNDHWRRYRRLEHEFVHCNLLTEPAKVLDRLGAGPNNVIWWSNAFFTVFSNWFYTIAERRTIYDVWVKSVAERSPQCLLYGFDHNNIGVNGIRAQEYADRYFRSEGDDLNPDKPCGIQIRC